MADLAIACIAASATTNRMILVVVFELLAHEYFCVLYYQSNLSNA